MSRIGIYYVNRVPHHHRTQHTPLMRQLSHLFNPSISSISMTLTLPKSLGQDVCCHSCSPNMLQRYGPLINFIPEPIKVQIQVLHPAMMFRILSNSKGRCTIKQQGGWT